MANATDVAQYVCSRLGRNEAWRLAILTYYSQAWSLGWFGRPMFTDEFQAWPVGPVAPKLHFENKNKGSDSTPPALPSTDLGNLSDSDKAIIDSVLEYYGDFSSQDLLERAQSELPWLEARKRRRQVRQAGS